MPIQEKKWVHNDHPVSKLSASYVPFSAWIPSVFTAAGEWEAGVAAVADLSSESLGRCRGCCWPLVIKFLDTYFLIFCWTVEGILLDRPLQTFVAPMLHLRSRPKLFHTTLRSNCHWYSGGEVCNFAFFRNHIYHDQVYQTNPLDLCDVCW